MEEEQRLAHPLSPMSTSRSYTNFRIVLLALLCGFFIGGCGFAVDHFVHSVDRLYASDLYTCIVAALLSYALMVFEKRRRLILARRMEIAAEVNHHIRNALTGVVLTASVQNDPTLHAVIDDATARIDWVLTTILPDDAEDLSWSTQTPSWRPKLWRGKTPAPAGPRPSSAATREDNFQS